MNTGLPSDLVPAARLDSFGIFWFFLSLSVESSVIPIADVNFEHRVYLPSAGFFIALVAYLFAAAERAKTTAPKLSGQLCRRCARRPRSVLMYARNGVWRGIVTLWEDADAARNLEAAANLRQRQRRCSDTSR